VRILTLFTVIEGDSTVDKVLAVDLEHPGEDNGGVLVVPFTNPCPIIWVILSMGSSLSPSMNIREICKETKPVRAFLVTPASYAPDPSPYHAPSWNRPSSSMRKLGKGSSRSVLLTWQRRQGVVKNSILADANRQVRCTILKFPEEMQLAAEFFMTIRGPLGDACEIFAIGSEYMMEPKKCSANIIFLQWVVHMVKTCPEFAVFSEASVMMPLGSST
jgi:hypothetical protein